jgi:shikimate dehydrogenase
VLNTPRSHRVGLIGAGIQGSLSPELHESEAAALGLEYRYELLDLDEGDRGPSDTGVVIDQAVAQGFNGFNVTFPCKQIVIDVVDDLSTDARELGAVNTITVHGGRLVGHNTDHSGFISALNRQIPKAKLSHVGVVGAGGAGSAAAYALAKAGASALTLFDVQENQALALADRISDTFANVRVSVAAAEDLPAMLSSFTGITNATPVGMSGFPGLPFDTSPLRSHHWVADVIYRPVETLLIQHARRAGCAVMDGGSMLVAQVAHSLRLLTGADPSMERIRSTFEGIQKASTVESAEMNSGSGAP